MASLNGTASQVASSTLYREKISRRLLRILPIMLHSQEKFFLEWVFSCNCQLKSVIVCHRLDRNSNFTFALFCEKLQPTAFHEKAIFLSFMSTAFEKLCKSVQQTKLLCRKFVKNVNFAHWLLMIFLTKCLCIFSTMRLHLINNNHLTSLKCWKESE